MKFGEAVLAGELKVSSPILSPGSKHGIGQYQKWPNVIASPMHSPRTGWKKSTTVISSGFGENNRPANKRSVHRRKHQNLSEQELSAKTEPANSLPPSLPTTAPFSDHQTHSLNSASTPSIPSKHLLSVKTMSWLMPPSCGRAARDTILCLSMAASDWVKHTSSKRSATRCCKKILIPKFCISVQKNS